MNDAAWIFLQHGTHCSQCRRWVGKGKHALWSRSQKTVFCTPCGNMLERAVKRPHELRHWGVKVDLN